MTQFYTHSGTVPLGGALRTTIEGIGVATFLAIIYAYAANYIPFVYLNFLFVLGFGAIIGWVVSHESQATKIRHTLVPVLIGLVCGVAGLYVAWAADLVARVGVPPNRGYAAALDPRVLLSYIQIFYEQGFWGIGKAGGVVSGKPLAVVWLIEGGIIVGLSVLIPWGVYGDNVFCESCGTWAKEEADVLRLNGETASEIVPRVQAGEVGVFRGVPLAEAGAAAFLRVKLHCCETCDDTNCLGLEQVTVKVDKEGKETESKSTLISRMIIAPSDVAVVRELAVAVAANARDDSADDAETRAESSPQTTRDNAETI